MKRRIILCAHLVVGVPVVVAYLATMVPAVNNTANRLACNSTLGCLDICMVAQCYPPVTTYPLSMTDFPRSDVSSWNFVCPTTRTQPPESFANVGVWSERIYLAGMGPASPPGIPVFVCPPCNHRGEGGNILFSHHLRQWVPSPEVDRSIDLMYAHAASNGLRVEVSEALAKRSGGKYRPYP